VQAKSKTDRHSRLLRRQRSSQVIASPTSTDRRSPGARRPKNARGARRRLCDSSKMSGLTSRARNVASHRRCRRIMRRERKQRGIRDANEQPNDVGEAERRRGRGTVRAGLARLMNLPTASMPTSNRSPINALIAITSTPNISRPLVRSTRSRLQADPDSFGRRVRLYADRERVRLKPLS